MSSTPQHTRIKRTTVIDDDTQLIIHESYTDKLSSVKEEVAKNIKTSRMSYLADLIACSDVFSKHETKKLTLEITADDNYQPKLIVKIWTTKKEYYGK
jgi:hypothetical protein